ncbi:MAG: hypothetical protein WCO28_04795 [Bacteroidota bacterium]
MKSVRSSRQYFILFFFVSCFCNLINAQVSYKSYIKTCVENKITRWKQKGEFEKSADYSLRVSEESQKRKELEQECLNALIQEEKDKILNTKSPFIISSYDADKEIFLIKGDKYEEIILSVPIAQAKKFKDSWIMDSIAQSQSFQDGNFMEYINSKNRSITLANPSFEFDGKKFILTHLDFVMYNKNVFSYDISKK